MSDIHHFCQLVTQKRVDVWYNYRWWQDLISSVRHVFKYKVYFWTTSMNFNIIM